MKMLRLDFNLILSCICMFSYSHCSLCTDAFIVKWLAHICFSPKALKVLRTSEFLPYVVFIEAPDFEVLKAMNRSAIESGVVTKQLTVSVCSLSPVRVGF